MHGEHGQTTNVCFYKELTGEQSHKTDNITATKGLPTLSEQQQEKLRLLSLLPLASSQANLTYERLQSSLSIPNAASLEQLVTKAIYTNLITGTLDPHHQVVNITSVAPLRDLAPGSIPALGKALTSWSAQCTSMLAALDAEIATVKRQAYLKGSQEKRVQTLLEEKIAAADKDESGRGKRSAGALDGMMVNQNEDEDAMDLDANEGRRLGRSAKRGGFGIPRLH